MLKKKNIVITGALGQDGIILSKLLLKKKYNVFGIIKKNNPNRLKNITYSKLNLLDFVKISDLLIVPSWFNFNLILTKRSSS